MSLTQQQQTLWNIREDKTQSSDDQILPYSTIYVTYPTLYSCISSAEHCYKRRDGIFLVTATTCLEYINYSSDPQCWPTSRWHCEVYMPTPKPVSGWYWSEIVFIEVRGELWPSWTPTESSLRTDWLGDWFVRFSPFTSACILMTKRSVLTELNTNWSLLPLHSQTCQLNESVGCMLPAYVENPFSCSPGNLIKFLFNSWKYHSATPQWEL